MQKGFACTHVCTHGGPVCAVGAQCIHARSSMHTRVHTRGVQPSARPAHPALCTHTAWSWCSVHAGGCARGLVLSACTHVDKQLGACTRMWVCIWLHVHACAHSGRAAGCMHTHVALQLAARAHPTPAAGCTHMLMHTWAALLAAHTHVHTRPPPSPPAPHPAIMAAPPARSGKI